MHQAWPAMDVAGDGDYGRRVRAARGYARLDMAELAKQTGVSKRTLARVEANQRPLRLPEARAIARACGVPLLFLLDGWRVYEQLDQFSAEQAADEFRRATRIMEELLGRLGRDVGRRGLQSRGGKDRPPGSPATAA